jgi:hypothetical protein
MKSFGAIWLEHIEDCEKTANRLIKDTVKTLIKLPLDIFYKLHYFIGQNPLVARLAWILFSFIDIYGSLLHMF